MRKKILYEFTILGKHYVMPLAILISIIVTIIIIFYNTETPKPYRIAKGYRVVNKNVRDIELFQFSGKMIEKKSNYGSVREKYMAVEHSLDSAFFDPTESLLVGNRKIENGIDMVFVNRRFHNDNTLKSFHGKDVSDFMVLFLRRERACLINKDGIYMYDVQNGIMPIEKSMEKYIASDLRMIGIKCSHFMSEDASIFDSVVSSYEITDLVRLSLILSIKKTINNIEYKYFSEYSDVYVDKIFIYPDEDIIGMEFYSDEMNPKNNSNIIMSSLNDIEKTVILKTYTSDEVLGFKLIR